MEGSRKLIEAKELFNKVFGSIKDIDIPNEYVKVKLKVSDLPASKRNLILAYVTMLRNNNPSANDAYNKLDELIKSKIEENKIKGIDTEVDFNNSKDEGTNISRHPHRGL